MTPNSLEDRLVRESRLLPREAVRIGSTLCRLVEQVHRTGGKLSPLRPSNVILNGNQVLLEDGAATTDSDVPPSAVGEAVFYASPEELAGQRADPRTDVYRLGALMYQMLIGSAPPRPQPLSRLPASPRLRRMVSTPSVHAIRRDVSRALDAAIGRALAHDPKDRFANAAQFADVLEESLVQRLDHQPHSDRPSQVAIVDSFEFGEEELRGLRRQNRGTKRRRALAVLLLLAAALAVILVRKGAI